MKDRRSPSASSCQRQAVPSKGVFSLAGGDVRPVIINDQTAELRSTVVNVTMPGYGTVNLMVSERIRPRNDCSLSAVSRHSSASANSRMLTSRDLAAFASVFPVSLIGSS